MKFSYKIVTFKAEYSNVFKLQDQLIIKKYITKKLDFMYEKHVFFSDLILTFLKLRKMFYIILQFRKNN